MNRVGQIKDLAEVGFAEAVQTGDVESKKFFMKVLTIIETTPSLKELAGAEPGPGNNNKNKFEDKGTPVQTRGYKRIECPEKVNTIAYFLSKYEHYGLFEGRSFNQAQTINKAAELLGVRPRTLRNMRDIFDRYTDSHRVGWDTNLNAIQEKVFEEMESKSKEDVLKIARDIISGSI